MPANNCSHVPTRLACMLIEALIHLNKSQASHFRCCGSGGWLVLCAVTLSPCTSVGLISLPLQLVITHMTVKVLI